MVTACVRGRGVDRGEASGEAHKPDMRLFHKSAWLFETFSVAFQKNAEIEATSGWRVVSEDGLSVDIVRMAHPLVAASTQTGDSLYIEMKS